MLKVLELFFEVVELFFDGQLTLEVLELQSSFDSLELQSSFDTEDEDWLPHDFREGASLYPDISESLSFPLVLSVPDDSESDVSLLYRLFTELRELFLGLSVLSDSLSESLFLGLSVLDDSLSESLSREDDFLGLSLPEDSDVSLSREDDFLRLLVFREMELSLSLPEDSDSDVSLSREGDFLELSGSDSDASLSDSDISLSFFLEALFESLEALFESLEDLLPLEELFEEQLLSLSTE